MVLLWELWDVLSKSTSDFVCWPKPTWWWILFGVLPGMLSAQASTIPTQSRRSKAFEAFTKDVPCVLCEWAETFCADSWSRCLWKTDAFWVCRFRSPTPRFPLRVSHWDWAQEVFRWGRLKGLPLSLWEFGISDRESGWKSDSPQRLWTGACQWSFGQVCSRGPRGPNRNRPSFSSAFQETRKAEFRQTCFPSDLRPLRDFQSQSCRILLVVQTKHRPHSRGATLHFPTSKSHFLFRFHWLL